MTEITTEITPDEAELLLTALVAGDPASRGYPDPKLELAKHKLRTIRGDYE